MSRAYFDAVAQDWDEMRSGFYPDALRERAADAAGPLRGADALDVGAGSGFLSEALVARGARVTALDASAAMLAELARRVPDVATRVGDAAALPFADGSFDAVLASMCLHHLERPDVAVREMARVLRPGGRVVIIDLDAHDHEFLRTEQHDRWLGFERERVAGWLWRAGLVDATVADADATCASASSVGVGHARVGVFLARAVRAVA